jgi:hypothetical protein
MKAICLVVSLLPVLAVHAIESRYSQVYTILINGAIAGTEKVTEETSKEGNLVTSSESEIFMMVGQEPKRMAFTTRTVLAKGSLAPITYSFKFTGGDSRDWFEVTVRDNSISRVLTRGSQTSEVSVPFQPGVVILDFSAYYHYEQLIRKYDSKKKGRQSFQNFIPVIASSIPLTVTELDEATVEHVKGPLRLRNFKIELSSGTRTRSVQVDKAGRLVRLWVPEQDLEVVRADLVPEPAPADPPKPPQP